MAVTETRKTKQAIEARPMPVEIVPPCGMTAKREKRIAEIKHLDRQLTQVSIEARDGCNAMVREWLGWHWLLGSSAELAAKSKVDLLPNELANRLYRAAADAMPNAASDVITSTLQWMVSTIRTQHSPRNGCKRALAVLSPHHSERAWHYAEAQPIRLTKKTARLEKVGDQFHLLVRCVKGEPEVRLRIKVRLQAPSKRGQKFVERVTKIADLPHLNGSLLFKRAGRWQFVYLHRYEVPVIGLPENPKTMFVRTCNEGGWRVRFNGQSIVLLTGEELWQLGQKRQEAMRIRATLREAGIKPQASAFQNARRDWEHYTTTLAEQYAHRMCEAAARHGVERICVMAGDEWCALGSIGNFEENPKEPTRFPFAVFARKMQENGVKRGIDVVSRPNLRSVKRRKELWRRKLQRDG